MPAQRLVISDVDGTLLGDDASLAEFSRWRQTAGAGVRLVYNSGRFFASVVESVRSTLLPEPDAIIGGVGTEIRHYGDGAAWAAWTASLDGWCSQRARAALAGFSRLEPQPDEFQSHWKQSYFADDLTEEELAEIAATLGRADVAARVVYSSQRDLDILPAGADKGSAAAFLVAQWRLEPAQTIVCGDSGNDLAMFGRGFRGVVVSNAHPELKALAGPDVYQSPYPFAAGVLDGLRHWGW